MKSKDDTEQQLWEPLCTHHSVRIGAGAVAGERHAQTLSLWYGDESCSSNGLSLALKLRDNEQTLVISIKDVAISELSRLAVES